MNVVHLPTMLDLYAELGGWCEPPPLIEDPHLPMLMQREHAHERAAVRRRQRGTVLRAAVRRIGLRR